MQDKMSWFGISQELVKTRKNLCNYKLVNRSQDWGQNSHEPSDSGDLVQRDDDGVDEHDGEGLEDHSPDGRVPLELLDVGDGQAEDEVHEDDRHVEHEQHENDSRHPRMKAFSAVLQHSKIS